MRTIALLGSTGSIGVSTLALVREFPEHFKVHGMVAGRNLPLLARQIIEFSPALVAIEREEDIAAAAQTTGQITKWKSCPAKPALSRLPPAPKSMSC